MSLVLESRADQLAFSIGKGKPQQGHASPWCKQILSLEDYNDRTHPKHPMIAPKEWQTSSI
jgi:hypothetical protein